MQHKDTNISSPSLASLPAVWSYWHALRLDEIYMLLRDTLIMKSAMVELPEHDNLQLLLVTVFKRLQYLCTDKMMKKCEAFALSYRDLSKDAQEGEKFLQINAMLSFYLGRFVDVAHLAGLLGNKYFLLNRCEYNKLSCHFNKIAGIAYQHLDDVVHASHHYNKYIFISLNKSFFPQEMIDIVSYLIDVKTLVVTEDTALRFFELPERCEGPSAKTLTTLVQGVHKKDISPAKDYFSACMPAAMRDLETIMLGMFKPRNQRKEVVTRPKPKIKILSSTELATMLTFKKPSALRPDTSNPECGRDNERQFK